MLHVCFVYIMLQHIRRLFGHLVKVMDVRYLHCDFCLAVSNIWRDHDALMLSIGGPA